MAPSGAAMAVAPSSLLDVSLLMLVRFAERVPLLLAYLRHFGAITFLMHDDQYLGCLGC